VVYLAEMPQPLKRINVKIDWGLEAVTNHPVLTSGVGACIMSYASVEAAMGVLLAMISWEDAIDIVDNWSDCRTARSKLKCVFDEAEARGVGHRKMVDIVFERYESLSKRRSKLAHGIFGIITDRENEFAWREGGAAAKDMANGLAIPRMIEPSKPSAWVYKVKDFQSLVQDCEKTMRLIDGVANAIPVIKGLSDPLSIS